MAELFFRRRWPHVPDPGLFWRPEGKGYTSSMYSAGLFERSSGPPSDTYEEVPALPLLKAAMDGLRPMLAAAQAAADGADGLGLESDTRDAATIAFDEIAILCGCPEWWYPGQLVRDVRALAGERDALKAANAMLRPALLAALLALSGFDTQNWQAECDCSPQGSLKEPWQLPRCSTCKRPYQPAGLVWTKDGPRLASGLADPVLSAPQPSPEPASVHRSSEAKQPLSVPSPLHSEPSSK